MGVCEGRVWMITTSLQSKATIHKKGSMIFKSFYCIKTIRIAIVINFLFRYMNFVIHPQMSWWVMIRIPITYGDWIRCFCPKKKSFLDSIVQPYQRIISYWYIRNNEHVTTIKGLSTCKFIVSGILMHWVLYDCFIIPDIFCIDLLVKHLDLGVFHNNVLGFIFCTD